MKRTFILLGLLILSLCIFSQNTSSPIKGAGNIKFGMTKDQARKALEKYKTADTNEIDAGDNLIVQNVKYEGEPFDECLMAFNKGKLMMVSFTQYSTMDEVDAAMERVQEKLVKQHGKPLTTNHDLAMWSDKDNRHVILKIETQGKLKVWLVYTSGF